ncbi:uncharacterized protein LOC131315260 [Rhododendron vialii]|uniref:uncharacterized protein LOC131315260 n=1 Tax=Rhododendron vialii TaxID=182163 RepID=UPI0026604C7B|nr:uncharacterized protein LOC131315260 [Rhododendron vialii]
MLQVDQKLILMCERKWIFHTVMFDEHGLELVFDWSGPNGMVAGMICPLLPVSTSIFQFTLAFCRIFFPFLLGFPCVVKSHLRTCVFLFFLDGLQTTCLPSLVTAHNAVVNFFISTCIALSYKMNLRLASNMPSRCLALEQMVIRMAACTWTIPIQGLHLNVGAFNEFAASLNSQFLNHIMVVMLPTVEFWVIVFDGHYDSERIYAWF